MPVAYCPVVAARQSQITEMLLSSLNTVLIILEVQRGRGLGMSGIRLQSIY